MLSLPLRQQKILQILQNATDYITGIELGRQLGVSPRTIRTDITEMNHHLAPLQARIVSVKSKGYLLTASDMDLLINRVRKDSVFLTREDRVRYLAYQLCLSDCPISLYDLEDEMSVSHTTLEHDIHRLKLMFVHATPHIQFFQQKEGIFFEKDEQKRRDIINLLIRQDWDYDNKGNAFYKYQFLDPDTLDIIMAETPIYLHNYGLSMEDASLVTLNLAIAIMYHRIRSGHPLPATAPLPKQDTAVMYATRDMMDALESKLHCSFRQEERDVIYQLISSSHLLDATKLSFATADQYFGPITLEMADHYLAEIDHVFHLDFSNDEDFYITLLQFIRSLQTSTQAWNMQGNPDIAKQNLQVDYEFAFLFQRTAQKYMGYFLNQSELLYLTYCVSGALEFYFQLHPEYKIRTVICSHLNLPGIWALKRKVLGSFANYINITALFPINGKSAFDFSDTDLILTTVRKEIKDAGNTDTLRISTFMDEADHRQIEQYLIRKKMERLCPHASVSLSWLLRNAFWHEKASFPSRFAAIERLASDFTANGLADESFTADILRRESICSFAFCPGILFLHSLIPAQKTQLSVAVMNHRIIWNRHKFRLIIMAAFSPEDAPVLFPLLQTFYTDKYDADAIRLLKTKEDVLAYYEA